FPTARAVALNSRGGTFNVAASTDLTLSGVISGAGDLTKTGSGALHLAAASPSSYTGATNVLAGMLQIAAGASASGGDAKVSGGVLDIAGGTFSPAGDINLNNGGT